MIKLKGQLSKREEKEVDFLIQEIPDYHSDFYLTKNNLRLYIKENLALLFENLKRGDKIAYCEDGIALVVGWADKSSRKYIKILAKDEGIVDHLLQAINWNIKCELFIKLKRKNPLLRVFYKNQFVFCGGRGKEILLKRDSKNSGELNKKR